MKEWKQKYPKDEPIVWAAQGYAVTQFFVEGLKDFHLLLRAKGIPASTWGGVIHPDLPLEEFPESRALYDGLIYLPVHQSLSVQEMDTMGRAVRDSL